MSGKLYLCATPIGNLDDMSFRAIRILKEVDLIAAEDTRRTGMLLKNFSIETPMIQYHKFNEKRQVSNIIERIENGANIALVSDAGTPGIADPGEILVKEAIEKKIDIVPIPGPCALICALTISGLDTTSFKFAGFLPKGNKKKKTLENLLKEEITIVCYQSPHDLINTLEVIEEIDSMRKLVLVREITKMYEERMSGTAKELLDIYETKAVKGEYTMVIEGNKTREFSFEDGVREVKNLLEQGEYLKKACKNIAGKMGLSQRELYQYFINLQKK